MEPNKVYKFNELINYPKSEKWVLRTKVRNAYLIILAIIFVSSIVFRDSLLSEMHWTYRVLLICIGLALCNKDYYSVRNSVSRRTYRRNCRNSKIRDKNDTMKKQ